MRPTDPTVPPGKEDVIAAVINFNTAGLTRRCTASLLDAGIAKIFVLDNGSGAADFAQLASDHASAGSSVRIVRSEENLGFAAGSNRLIEEALRDPECARVLLVNSDARVDAKGLDACLGAMALARHDLMGGRMLKPGASSQSGAGEAEVDSLGITLYKCLLASNRKSVADKYLGPTGGLAVYSRDFLEEAVRLHGYVFDPSYFCYAEDTDLCIRARLLGRSVGYTDEVVAYHEGQASTTGGYGDFILYHGIRNSIWTMAKCIPTSILLAHLPWIVALHGGIVLRHLLQGRWKTLWRLYRDALAGLPSIMGARRRVQASRRIDPAAFRSCIDRRFYETRFLEGAVRDLFRRS